MGISRQEYWSGLPFPSPVGNICQNSPLWPVRLGWPYMAWLIVSLSYTRLWSMWSVWLVFCDCGFHSVWCWSWNQYSGHLMGRTDSLEKTVMLGNWRQEKGMTEDEMVGWHHWLNGHELGQARNLVGCSPWGCKESDTTERLNWNDLTQTFKNAVYTTL